jgi:hypothetical protein
MNEGECLTIAENDPSVVWLAGQHRSCRERTGGQASGSLFSRDIKCVVMALSSQALESWHDLVIRSGARREVRQPRRTLRHREP